MEIKIPELALVVLIGPSGAGKTTFASKNFLPTEVVSSDACRGLVADDENDQSVNNEAFDLLHFIIRQRLSLGRLTVVDATNVQPEARRPLLALAREFHLIPAAIVFDLPERICHEHNKNRKDRRLGPRVVSRQRGQMRRSLRKLKYEGFRHIYTLDSVEAADGAFINRQPLWNNKKDLSGPFDIIGDIHGCGDELENLLLELGYARQNSAAPDPVWGDLCYAHPEGRTAVFLGDLVDRGPRVLDVLRLARNMVQSGNALCVPGNHDIKFLRKLWGKNVQITHGLDKTLAEYEALPDGLRDRFQEEAASFLHGLVSHYVLDSGRLVVAHAGMPASMQGRGSGRVRQFALYGETTGETDEFGLPVRYNWALDYRGTARVVYGHTPVPEPEWLNRTVNIDTGCVFGGGLTALRYPENEFVSVPALETYTRPAKPFLSDGEEKGLSAQQKMDDLLDAEDVLGKRHISTRFNKNITIREENAAAALEVMSRFAADPKWLIYLPPTMSPCGTSTDENYLEYPSEAFEYYRSMGQTGIVCEEKHMGSRAVVIVCRDEEAARNGFGVENDGTGLVYTRTGRRFFTDRTMEQALIARIGRALDRSGFWDEYDTGWVCLDCELMPWSAKARELIKSQYAAVGAAAEAALGDALALLKQD